ncbi:MAG: IclR family transcriptional regulator [Pseudomonadota bacterium]|nr:IclR family transcriptional regulator [Pseudomonadota bacterium]
MSNVDEQADDAGGTAKPRVQSAVRVSRILIFVAESSAGVKARDISERLGIPRQATYHLVHTLLTIGMLRKNDQNRYVLGLAAAPIASGLQRQLAPQEHIRSLVRSVVSETHETAYAVGWVEDEVVILFSARGDSVVQAAEESLGRSYDAHARASGKLLLALADADRRDRYISRHALTARTPNTLTTLHALNQALDEIRAQGYSLEREEYALGLSCLAVPVPATQNKIALAISVPKERLEQRLEDYLATMRRIVQLT